MYVFLCIITKISLYYNFSQQPKTPVKKKVAEERTIPASNVVGHAQHSIHAAPLSQQVNIYIFFNLVAIQQTPCCEKLGMLCHLLALSEGVMRANLGEMLTR